MSFSLEDSRTSKAVMQVEKNLLLYTSVTNSDFRESLLALLGDWTAHKWRQSFYKSCVYDITWRLSGQLLRHGNNSGFVWFHRVVCEKLRVSLSVDRKACGF